MRKLTKSVNETTDSKKPHHVVSRNAPLAEPCSIHTGRTQKQRSSQIVCAACSGISGILFKAITTAILCGTVLSANSSPCQAEEENPTIGENLTAGEVYNTALEAAYGDTFRSVYENHLAGSPLEAEAADGVDTATGHLILSRSDLSLEGTGGMDFELNRYYDSNEANLGHATVEYTEKLEVDTVWVSYTASDGSKRRLAVNAALLKNHKKALKNLLVTYTKGEVCRNDEISTDTQRTKIVSSEGHNVYGIASGWRYDFPWIETVTVAEGENSGKEPKYLHYGSAGVIQIKSEKQTDKDGSRYRIKGLEGYDYDDIRLEDWDKTVDGIACRYLLRDSQHRRGRRGIPTCLHQPERSPQ